MKSFSKDIQKNTNYKNKEPTHIKFKEFKKY
jgi:hypothetical protein